MDQPKIYVVLGFHVGLGPDQAWPVKAFKDQEKANNFKDLCQNEIKKLSKQYDELFEDFESEKKITGLSEKWIKATGEKQETEQIEAQIRELDSFKKYKNFVENTKNQYDPHTGIEHGQNIRYDIMTIDFEE